MPVYNDQDFIAHVTSRLAALPCVRAVALGGSRATGTHGPDSDWDFAVYYHGGFSPESLRALGWPGEISDIGGWGGGVFNGGAWLSVDDRHIDVHYRDLDDVEHQLAEAREGRFGVERLLFHLAGIPTYIVVAELAVNQVLHGDLPRPEYPEALRRAAPQRWWGDARHTLAYARAAHAARGHLADCAGAIATAACQAAHAVLAARGQWVTNEKTLLDRAGIRDIDGLLSGLAPRPEALTAAIDEATALLESAVSTACATQPSS
ncbi:nucleotidyltransferase domain-containing protein [Streptantibioticus rubrisoli]|uniref:Nucleotidyltransferase domain-containing protein n=1 Tax=Streptantibioticus rubrisoli TaxID=1387313 RepID=A0ABT1PCP9_9ACTN|nr:nucleotidyltransferase domain-containing protein [Streptantibioticus rubrisoli]MCQ4042586.1 nucleotidyltransferase domain-containing protein [Streptantibioticus rubrisoli]